MEQVTDVLANYATKEVLTVFAALGVAWVGWKAAAKTYGVASAFAQKASFMGITAGVLFLAGTGITGLGIGELVSRVDIEDTGSFKNDQLLKIVNDDNVSLEVAREILTYAQNRDSQLPDSDQKLVDLVESNPESLTAFIELLKAREERIGKQVKAEDFVTLTSYDSPSDLKEFDLVEANEVTVQDSSTLMNVPLAWLCIMLGIGGAITGVTCFANSPVQKSNNSYNTHM